MKFKIDVWINIPAEEQDDPLIFDNMNEALKAKLHLQLLQPENRYEVVVVEED